ncbi:MAG: hypothetical protein RLZZ399_1054 [Verrucomicrobiota bacterium]|jgi:hypothetical protein
MSIRFPAIFVAALALAPLVQAEPEYEFVPKFLTLPAGRETIGNGHGEIQVDSAGKIYVSVDGFPEGGIQVYSPEGQYLKTLPVPGTLHGFSIRKQADGEFIFAAVLGQQRVLKTTLEGEVVMEIPKTAFPPLIADKISFTLKDGTNVVGHSPVSEGNTLSITKQNGEVMKISKSEIAQKVSMTLSNGKKAEGIFVEQTDTEIKYLAGGKLQTIAKSEISLKDGKPAYSIGSSEVRGGLRLTSADAAPNGDIYVVDGYGTSWIFVFDSQGKFKKQFGGPVEPFKLSNCHKVHVDNRFEPARLFLCDRGNNRMLHTSLDGELLGVIADKDLRKPSSASFFQDLVCVAEIAGRVSIWNKEGKMVAALGTNDTPGQAGGNGVLPADWRDNVVTSPHGITFDAKGNILETEYNKYGRVLRWNRK